MAKFFPRLSVRKMDFNGRQTNGRDGVPQCNTGMGIGASVQHYHLEITLGFLNPSDQFALVIGLAEVNADSKFGGAIPHHTFDLSQGRASIDRRLPLAEQVEVRSV